MDQRRMVVILSPVLVIGIGALTVRLAEPFLGVWAWVPYALVYWALIWCVASWGSGKAGVRRWMGPPQGSWLWTAMAFVIVLPTASMFTSSWQLLKPVHVWLPWLIFGLVNPLVEECYWRGALLDATRGWSSWITIPGVSLLFSLEHLFTKGVTSIGERHPVFLFGLFVFGVVFGIAYKKTGSVRWLVVAHALSDLLGLSVPVLLNLWVPPS